LLDARRGTPATHFVENRVLRIKPVRITSIYQTKNIIFRVGESEYTPQLDHVFFSDQSEMITEQLRSWLQQSGLFSRVIVSDEESADMVLESAVTALYGEQRNQFSPQAVLEMQFFLSAERADLDKVLFQTGLRVETDIDQTTPANVVKGWKIGLTELFSTLEDDLSGYFSKATP